MAYIKSLHAGWSSEVHQVLDATTPDSVEQRDLYDRAPELLRSWAKGPVVLVRAVGGALRAPPPLGQGPRRPGNARTRPVAPQGSAEEDGKERKQKRGRARE